MATTTTTTTTAATTTKEEAAAAATVDGQTTAAEDRPLGGGGGDAAPASPAALLIVIGELQSGDERDLALQRVVDGLLSFDCEKSGCNLEDEVKLLVTRLTKDGSDDAGDGVFEWKSERLHVVILVNPHFDVVQKNLCSFLLTSSCYRFLLYSGLMLQNSGCWFLRDAYLDLSSISEVFHRPDVCHSLSTQLGSQLDICVVAEVGEWTPDSVSKLSSHLTIRLNPPKLTEQSDCISSFSSFLSAFLAAPSSADDFLLSTTAFGNFSQACPTLHVFPGGQGDSALFSVNGVNLLFDGGYGRKSCFWDLIRHLRCLDAIVLSHFGPDNLFGLESFLEKKVLTNGFPEIGTIFFNTPKTKSVQTADKTVSLLVNLADRASHIFDVLHLLNAVVLPCLGSVHSQTLLPIPLYHKVGHGSVDLYVLNPLADNKEAKELISNWTKSLGSHKTRVPVVDHVSLCSLLVWKSVSASENPVRILFSGNTPQAKIFEGLDRLKCVGIFQNMSGIVEKSANGAKLAAGGGKTAPVAKVRPHTAAKQEKKDTVKAANEQKVISEKTKTEKKVADHQREPKKIAGDIKDEKRMQTEKKNEKIPSTATKKNVPGKGGQSTTKIMKKQEGDTGMKKETETHSASDIEVSKIEASNEKGMKNVADVDNLTVEAKSTEEQIVSSAAANEDNLLQSQALKPTADLETEELKVEKGMLEEEEREVIGTDKGSPNASDSKSVKSPQESLTNTGFNPEREWGIPEGLPAPVNGKEPTAARKVGHNAPASATSADSNDIKKVGDASGVTVTASVAAKRPATAPDRQNNAVRNGTKNVGKSATGQSTAGWSSARGDPKKHPAKPFVPFYVDVAYIPAHGSPSHFDANFFCRVRARYYVLSSISPILKALALLVEGKQTWDDPSTEVTVIPTHSSDSLIAWISENQDQLQKVNIKVAPPASKCTVQLLDTACASYRIEF